MYLRQLSHVIVVHDSGLQHNKKYRDIEREIHKVTEVNLSVFVCRLSHEDFFSLVHE